MRGKVKPFKGLTPKKNRTFERLYPFGTETRPLLEYLIIFHSVFYTSLREIILFRVIKKPLKTEAFKRIEKSDYALAATLILIRPEKPPPSLTTT